MLKSLTKIGLLFIIIGLVIGVISAIVKGTGIWDFWPNYDYKEEIFTINKEEVNAISIETYNERITVIPTNDNIVTIKYNIGDNKTYTKSTNGNKVSLERDKNQMPWMRIFNIGRIDNEILISIPKDLISDVSLDTSNAKINIEDLDFTILKAESSNGSVNLKNINVSSDINIRTGNGKIDLSNIITKDYMELWTSNGSIDLVSVETNKIKIKTSNASIKLDKLNADNIDIRTSNASVKGTVVGNKEEFNEELKTSNGSTQSMNAEDNNRSISNMYSKEIKVNTSNGSIEIIYE